MQAELDAFFALLERRTRLCRVVTASAFSKARSRLWANVFDPLNDELLRLIDECIPAQPLWLGLRVLAADASKVRLTLLDRAGKRCIREGAVYGLPQANSVQMAADEINAAGGIKAGGDVYKLRVIANDDKANPTEAAKV